MNDGVISTLSLPKMPTFKTRKNCQKHFLKHGKHDDQSRRKVLVSNVLLNNFHFDTT